MLTQHYKLEQTLEQRFAAKRGQFVYESNETDEIIGFISDIDKTHVYIMFFEPRELKPYMEHIESQCDWKPVLAEILFTADTDIQEMWREALSNAI